MSVDEALRTRPPAGCYLADSVDEPVQPYLLQTRALITGDQLADAQPGFDQQTQEAIVSFRFNTSGATTFGQATTENVGQPFAIVLDDEVISAPVIREPILGGSGQISGNFTPELANDLAILLRAGACLPTLRSSKSAPLDQALARIPSPPVKSLASSAPLAFSFSWAFPMVCSGCSPTSPCSSTSR
jgi:SecD/SecF fusion protein